MTKKRSNGQYFTKHNPFDHVAFFTWSSWAGLPHKPILEPFAGQNSLIDHLKSLDLCNQFASYDIEPARNDVVKQDTLSHFPSGYDVCITNPPWLAKNSATARRLPFQGRTYNDVYQYALSRCLEGCSYVAALLPESFIRSGVFQERLYTFISLKSELFTDTSHPVGLALFVPNPSEETHIWSGSHYVGTLAAMKKYLPDQETEGIKTTIRFNDPCGNLGFIAFDNTREASIRFCDPGVVSDYHIKSSSRFITKIAIPESPKIDAYNEFIQEFRTKTHDVFLTCYRGLRKDGRYRRRLDYKLARKIIAQT